MAAWVTFGETTIGTFRVFVGVIEGSNVGVIVGVSVNVAVTVGVNVGVLVSVTIEFNKIIYSLILSGNNPQPSIKSTMKLRRKTGKNLGNHFTTHPVMIKSKKAVSEVSYLS